MSQRVRDINISNYIAPQIQGFVHLMMCRDTSVSYLAFSFFKHQHA